MNAMKLFITVSTLSDQVTRDCIISYKKEEIIDCPSKYSVVEFSYSVTLKYSHVRKMY